MQALVHVSWTNSAQIGRMQALKSNIVSRKASFAPFKGTTQRVARVATVVRAAENNGVAPSSGSDGAPTLTFKQIPPLVWRQDTESIRDVFAFAGPAPERVNGRLAMWAFASFALTELNTQTPVAEQFAEGWLAAAFFSYTILFASLVPKLVSGTSLKELLASATTANMQGEGIQQVLAYFDTNLELWTGRAAMVGVAGLLVVEAITKDALF